MQITTIKHDLYLAIIRNLNSAQAVLFANVVAWLRGAPVRFKWHGDSKLYSASQEERKNMGGELRVTKRYFPSKTRGMNYYSNGVVWRSNSLYDQYGVRSIINNLTEGDLVLDVGANYGDFSTSIDQTCYVAIEPGPREAESLRLSLPSVKIFECAVSNFEGKEEFFLAEDTGDSALERNRFHDEVTTVQVRTLDGLWVELGSPSVTLLKLETEGHELEALEGFKIGLPSVKFIAVDGGAEKGEALLPTIHQVANFLIPRGFDMIWVNLKLRPGTALFRNRAFED